MMTYDAFRAAWCVATWVAMPAVAAAQVDTSLVGLWQAKRWFGPELRGALRLVRTGNRWEASIGPRTVAAYVGRDSVFFDIPAGGAFRGRLKPDGSSMNGHWIQPPTMRTGRRHATPVVLTACGAGCFAGNVQPFEDEFTFYMNVKARADGKLGAFLRNPERNQGRFIGLDHLVRRGDTVLLRNAGDSTIETAVLRFGRLSAMFRGATFDFQKVHPDSFTYFYPRGRPSGTYAYSVPRARNDGWPVARAEEVGMSSEKLAAMVQTIVNASVDSAAAFRLHGILVARHGRLVLEEYFFGEHADRTHETRSASKTILPVVLGAAMHAGYKVGPQTPVYATLGDTSAALEPRKRSMTLLHPLTMSSGLDCDDSGELRPGNEEVLTEQNTNPDWTRMILELKTLRDPGEKAVYCSINSFLGGEVVRRATGRWIPELVWDLVGQPLQMAPYSLQLSPLGEGYLGGGAYFRPRDFMKLAQLYANGGTWKGRRIVSEAWIRESIQPRYTLFPPQQYGYQWWTLTYPYQGRRISVHYASGNGGQFTMFFPELALVVSAWGGNYADRGAITMRDLIPNQILPAILK
jgi:CubicO group peptidase (beta-lactamase class C family)